MSGETATGGTIVTRGTNFRINRMLSRFPVEVKLDQTDTNNSRKHPKV